MTTIAGLWPTGAPPRSPRFAPRHPADAYIFAILTFYVWLGIVMGFGGEILAHYAQHKPAYPLIVHVHAIAFVGWLLLFTTQVALVRSRRLALHRRVGIGMIGLAIVMMVLGPVTAIIIDRARMAVPGGDGPSFLYIQFADMLAFGGLVAAGVRLRWRAADHKRLMILSLLAISDAGFARWLFAPIGHVITDPFWLNLVGGYGGNDVGIVALGLYDLVTRRRLNGAYVGGVAFLAAIQLIAVWAYLEPAARPLVLRLLGA
ncbi:hypothetical protein HL653_13605 [Sphingomonas sp. AP4-R1]|uniref:hypothetical protein n=1 Tax=Sphingomonas sp. AP4-R1 TaxID=2735134 RepID=UPI00149336BC|nr:hypothetical protein [Sphingomonas sp. AP4-R1]QJU58662.1 hypothetical protein HL653_13605 [Sphingomonas sp. AP4-R1]